VQWKELFKDGSFNKSKIREGGTRVRTRERMWVIEQGKAEAKFAGKVKEKEQELKIAAKDKRDMQEEADSSRRMQEKKARQTEKDLTAGHKRRLMELGVDVEKKRKLEMRAQEEIDRQHRAKVRELEKQLEDMQEELHRSTAKREELERRVKRGTERLDGLRAYGDCWKKKYTPTILIPYSPCRLLTYCPVPLPNTLPKIRPIHRA
jgi:hypothetical protein